MVSCQLPIAEAYGLTGEEALAVDMPESISPSTDRLKMNW